MKAEYLIIDGNKATARVNLESGMFFTWTDENLKNAFAFGNGTMKDFQRFAKDNAKNTTCIEIGTLKYIDTGKDSNMTRRDLESVFAKWNIA